jgi:Protein of unknown function (DUF2817)
MPPNPECEALHEWLAPSDFDGAGKRTADSALQQYVERHGMWAFHVAVGSGQYTRPNGIFHGGVLETCSNRTFRKIVQSLVPAGSATGALLVRPRGNRPGKPRTRGLIVITGATGIHLVLLGRREVQQTWDTCIGGSARKGERVRRQRSRSWG